MFGGSDCSRTCPSSERRSYSPLPSWSGLDVAADSGRLYRAAAAEAADRANCFSPEDRESLWQLAETPQQPLPGGATPGEVTVEPTESSTTAE